MKKVNKSDTLSRTEFIKVGMIREDRLSTVGRLLYFCFGQLL